MNAAKPLPVKALMVLKRCVITGFPLLNMGLITDKVKIKKT